VDKRQDTNLPEVDESERTRTPRRGDPRKGLSRRAQNILVRALYDIRKIGTIAMNCGTAEVTGEVDQRVVNHCTLT